MSGVMLRQSTREREQRNAEPDKARHMREQEQRDTLQRARPRLETT